MPTELNPAQVAAYRQKGFVVLAPVFDAGELADLHRAADLLLARSGPVRRDNPRIEVEPKPQRTNPSIHLQPGCSWGHLPLL